MAASAALHNIDWSVFSHSANASLAQDMLEIIPPANLTIDKFLLVPLSPHSDDLQVSVFSRFVLPHARTPSVQKSRSEPAEHDFANLSLLAHAIG
jgi:hypothetical protein